MSSEARLLKDENVKLKRKLVRKEKALAETAPLLVLQKKFRALERRHPQLGAPGCGSLES